MVEMEQEVDKYADSILSNESEVNALLMGIGMGLYSAYTLDVSIVAAVVVVALGVGSVSKLERVFKKYRNLRRFEEFVSDIKKEPVYAIVGCVVSSIILSVFINGYNETINVITSIA